MVPWRKARGASKGGSKAKFAPQRIDAWGLRWIPAYGRTEPLAGRHVIFSGMDAGCTRESSLETLMSDNTGGGSTSFLAFIVGGLVVAVGVLAFLYFGLHVIGPKASSTTTTITAPSTSGTTTNSTTTTTP